MEALGTQVAFNVQKHSVADAGHVDPGETVIIFERGKLREGEGRSDPS